MRHSRPAHNLAAPHTVEPESEPPTAPAQSARLQSDGSTAADSEEATRTDEPLARLRIASRHTLAPDLDTESMAMPADNSSIDDAWASTIPQVSLHATRIVPVAPLRGSLASLVRQNERTDADHLERIENDADLRDRIARGMLVPVPTSGALTINQSLPLDRRYCRPWTAQFLADLARAHVERFHRPLEVSSAVRTVDYQKRLIGVNGNAAAAEGDIVSPHVTGATIDIAKKGLSTREIYWMRGRLLALQDQGKLDVEEEFQQSCFHITVYKSYTAGRNVPRRRHHGVTPVSAPAPATSSDETDNAAGE